MGFEVENCCCCFSLETGTKIIGAVELLGGISSLVLGANAFGRDDLAASVTVVQGIIATIVGILLIIGVIKKKAAYLFPFLFSMAVGIVKYAIEFIGNINRALSQEKVDNNNVIGMILADVLIIGLGIYFLIVVYTLYKQFKSSSSSNGGIA